MKAKKIMFIWVIFIATMITITAFAFGVEIANQEYKIYAAEKESEAALIKAESLKKIRICIAEAAEERAVHMAKAQTETKRLIANSLSLFEGIKLNLFKGLFEEAFGKEVLTQMKSDDDTYMHSMNELDKGIDKIEKSAKVMLNKMKSSTEV